MSEYDEFGRRVSDDPEGDYEARQSRVHCKCGYPDWPGQCPGWANCPVHGEGGDE